MGEPVKKIPQTELVWDKKRILVATTIILLIAGGAVYFAQNSALGIKKNEGNVAGVTIQEEKPITLPPKEDLENSIENIKKEITELKPQNLAQQEHVQKIITELETIQKNVETQVVGGTKNVVCEEVKKVFCSQ